MEWNKYTDEVIPCSGYKDRTIISNVFGLIGYSTNDIVLMILGDFANTYNVSFDANDITKAQDIVFDAMEKSDYIDDYTRFVLEHTILSLDLSQYMENLNPEKGNQGERGIKNEIPSSDTTNPRDTGTGEKTIPGRTEQGQSGESRNPEENLQTIQQTNENTLGDIIDGINRKIQELLDGSKTIGQETIEKINENVKEQIENIELDTSGILDDVGNIIEKTTKTIGDIVDKTTETITDIVDSTTSTISESIDSIVSGISDTFGNIFEGIQNLLSKILGYLEKFYEYFLNFLEKLLEILKKAIDYLYQKGIELTSVDMESVLNTAVSVIGTMKNFKFSTI